MTIPALLQIQQVPIDDLRPDPANPRRISDAQLEALTKSLKEFGFVQPVLARREDKTVIGGHQRLTAVRRLGYKTVPVVWLDISLEQARLLNLSLNKISGDWDNELLARLLADLAPVEGIDLSLSGFGEDEVKKLFRQMEVREKKDRVESFDLNAAMEAARAAPRAKRGELWAMGDHRLLVGDSCDVGDVSRLFDGTKAAMTFEDPPYNVDYGKSGGSYKAMGRRRAIANDSMSPEQWETFARAWCRNTLNFTDGAIYICMSSRELGTVDRLLREEGGHWSDTIIWAKDRFVPGKADYQRGYEPLWFGWREGVRHHWCGDRDQNDVWRIDRPLISDLHPTMKPLPLIERAIQNSSRPGDLVADLFLGSGSTLIACERTGRICSGVEIDEMYATIIIARWEAFTGETAVKL